MSKKFSLKLYREFKLVNYPEAEYYDERTDVMVYTPESDEYCITFSEYIFNVKIDEPPLEIKESFENVHEIFVQNKFEKNQNKRDEFILIKNKEQVKIVDEKFAKWKIKIKEDPDSLIVQRKYQYLATVRSEFKHWFDVHGLEFPSIIEISSGKGEQKTPPPNESLDSTNLSSFMRKLLKNKDAKKYLKSDMPYKKKEKFVRDAIKDSSLNIRYRSVTLTRYIKPDKIEEFLRKKK